MKTFREYNDKQPINEVLGTLATLGIVGGLAGLAAKGWLHPITKGIGQAAGSLVGGALSGIASSKDKSQGYGYSHPAREFQRGRETERRNAEDERKRIRRIKHKQKVSGAKQIIKDHASSIGFDPSNSTSMSGYHNFMGLYRKSHRDVGINSSGLATHVSSAAPGHPPGPHPGASGSRGTIRVLTPEEHERAKFAHKFLERHGHI
jgi:hypothetical protein